MYLCYFDESGDSGYVNSPSEAFTLAALMIHDSEWLQALDEALSFRRYLRDNFGIRPRMEIKSNWLLKGKREFGRLGLSPAARRSAFDAALRFQQRSGRFRTFAIVIDKGAVKSRSTVDPREKAWTFALQRVHSFAQSKRDRVLLFPDDGHGYFIRRLVRRIRRHQSVPGFYGGVSLSVPATTIVEDVSERRSSDSVFVQLADLNAYAATRHVFPNAGMGPAAWDLLGNARVTAVNSLRGGPTGIVKWP